MAATAQQFNSLLNETNKAKQATLIVLDYVDLVSKHWEDLAPDAAGEGDKIKDYGHEINKHIDELRRHIKIVFDKMPVDDKEIKVAADKALLYQGGVDHAMNWAESERKGYKENSYWWRYWQAVYDKLNERKVER